MTTSTWFTCPSVPFSCLKERVGRWGVAPPPWGGFFGSKPVSPADFHLSSCRGSRGLVPRLASYRPSTGRLLSGHRMRAQAPCLWPTTPLLRVPPSPAGLDADAVPGVPGPFALPPLPCQRSDNHSVVKEAVKASQKPRQHPRSPETPTGGPLCQWTSPGAWPHIEPKFAPVDTACTLVDEPRGRGAFA